jgi:[ribosomal protein S18]-alanine N-acetyltransferase
MTVELLGDDEADLAACEAIDRASFAAPSFSLSEERARPMSRIFVVRPRPDALPVGFLLAWVVVDELHVLTVAVDPSSRRSGHGRALVEAALSLAGQSKLSRLLLEVKRSNAAAITLYRRAGFHVFNVRRRYYTDGEDAVEMSARLDPETGQPIPEEDEEPVAS